MKKIVSRIIFMCLVNNTSVYAMIKLMDSRSIDASHPSTKVREKFYNQLRDTYREKTDSPRLNTVQEYCKDREIDLLMAENVILNDDVLEELAKDGLFSALPFEVKVFNMLTISQQKKSLIHESACRALLLGLEWWATETVCLDRQMTYSFSKEKYEAIADALTENLGAINKISCNGKTILMLFSEAFNFNFFMEDTYRELKEILVHLCGILLKKGARLDTQDLSGRTPLHFAAQSGNEKLCALFLEKGASRITRDKNQETPLDLVVPWKKSPIRLIEKDWTKKDDEVYSFNNDSSSNREKICRLMVSGIPFDQTPMIVTTLLHRAAEAGEIRLLFFLLKDVSIDHNATNAYGQTPLHMACLRNQLGAARVFLMFGSNLLSLDAFGNTPAHYMCASGLDPSLDLGLFQGLLREKTSGWNPLHWACYFGNVTAVRFLLQQPIDVNCTVGDSKKTPLIIASERGHVEVCELLLIHGLIDVKLEDALVGSALDWACEFEHIDVCKIFLRGKFATQSERQKVLLLQRALQNDNKRLQNLFLKTWPVWDTQNSDGDTVLHIACREGRVDVIRILKNYCGLAKIGAQLKNNDNKLPKECISEKHSALLGDLLQA